MDNCRITDRQLQDNWDNFKTNQGQIKDKSRTNRGQIKDNPKTTMRQLMDNSQTTQGHSNLNQKKKIKNLLQANLYD